MHFCTLSIVRSLVVYELLVSSFCSTLSGSGNSTVQAFVDLKSSPDPSTTSDTSELSDSLKSETKVAL